MRYSLYQTGMTYKAAARNVGYQFMVASARLFTMITFKSMRTDDGVNGSV